MFNRLRRLFLSSKLEPAYGWSGNYSSWQEAQAKCTGYDAANILEKCKNSLLEVKAGEAVYERDSVLFDHIEYSWPLLAGLMYVAAVNGGKLSVLDFGGSLGSTYYQNKKFLSNLKFIEWSIVEQDNFVECGNKEFADNALRFYKTIDDCSRDRNPNVLILSSVLQYLEKPYQFIDMVLNLNFPFIIIDRTAFINDLGRELLTVQRVPPEIYPASYPAWFFSENRLLEIFRGKYDVMADFDALDKYNIEKTYSKGFIMKSKRDA